MRNICRRCRACRRGFDCRLRRAGRSRAADPAPVTIVVFNPPSLGAIFPSVIKQQKFDIANGIDITFVERPPDAYAAEFNSGEFQVGGSASVLILGLGATRGIKTSYLFNLFDYWGTVVTSRPDIKTLADLAGKQTGRRQRHHELHDVRVAGEAAGRRSQFLPGRQYRDAGPCRLRVADRADAVQIVGAGLYLVKAVMPDRSIPSTSISQKCGTRSPAAANALSRRRGASGMDRCASRSHSGPLSRLQAGRRLGHGQSGRGGAAGRDVERRRRAAGDHRADARQFPAGAQSPAGRQDQQRRSRRPTGPASMSACSRKCRRPPRSIAARWSDGARGRRSVGRVAGAAGKIFCISPGFRYESVVALAGLAIVWQIASLFVPHFLFPSVPEIAARLVRDLHVVELDLRRAGDQRPHSRRPWRRFRARHAARHADGAFAALRALRLSAAEFQPGHPGSVLGRDRHHLVSRHRVPHLFHHGDDDAAGLHLSGARRLSRHVEGPVRNDAVVPPDAGSICSAR